MPQVKRSSKQKAPVTVAVAAPAAVPNKKKSKTLPKKLVGVKSVRSIVSMKKVVEATQTRKKPESKSKKAGVTFPIGRIERYLRQGRYALRVSSGSGVFMASVLEYLSAELLELAGNACIDNQKKRITPRHILLAIKNDEELTQLLQKATISSGGVLPSIHSALLPKKSGQPQSNVLEKQSQELKSSISEAK